MITLWFSDVICEFPHVNQLKSFVRQPIITIPNFSEPIKKHDIVGLGLEKTPNLKNRLCKAHHKKNVSSPNLNKVYIYDVNSINVF